MYNDVNNNFSLKIDENTIEIKISKKHRLAKRILAIVLEEDQVIKQWQKQLVYPSKGISNAVTPEFWPFKLPPNEIEDNKMLKGEYEWTLLYGYVLAASGKDSFTKADLRQVYKDTERLNLNNYKSLSTNVKKCLNKGFFSGDLIGQIVLTEKGKEHIQNKLVVA